VCIDCFERFETKALKSRAPVSTTLPGVAISAMLEVTAVNRGVVVESLSS
jgi:hypothetical protein